jgi:hypothetical protein
LTAARCSSRFAARSKNASDAGDAPAPGANPETLAMTNIPTPDVVALVRRRYLEGATVRAIAAESGTKSQQALYDCLDGRYPDDSGSTPAAIPRRKPGMGLVRRKGSRAALIGRMWRTAQKQVKEIENRLKLAGLPLAERESGGRMLAVVARTLRELNAVDEAQKRAESPNSTDDEHPPQNIEDLRQALARKLQEFVRRESAEVPDDAERD